MNRIFRNTIFYLLIFLVIIGVVSFFNGGNEPTNNLSYDQFIEKLENGEVANTHHAARTGRTMKCVVSLEGTKRAELYHLYFKH